MTSTLYLLTAGMSSFELEEIRVTKRTGDVLSRLGAVVYGRICCMVYYSQRMPATVASGNAVFRIDRFRAYGRGRSSFFRAPLGVLDTNLMIVPASPANTVASLRI